MIIKEIDTDTFPLKSLFERTLFFKIFRNFDVINMGITAHNKYTGPIVYVIFPINK